MKYIWICSNILEKPVRFRHFFDLAYRGEIHSVSISIMETKCNWYVFGRLSVEKIFDKRILWNECSITGWRGIYIRCPGTFTEFEVRFLWNVFSFLTIDRNSNTSYSSEVQSTHDIRKHYLLTSVFRRSNVVTIQSVFWVKLHLNWVLLGNSFISPWRIRGEPSVTLHP